MSQKQSENPFSLPPPKRISVILIASTIADVSSYQPDSNQHDRGILVTDDFRAGLPPVQ